MPNMVGVKPQDRDLIWPYNHEINASGWLRARDYGHATMLCRMSQQRPAFLIAALLLLTLFTVVLFASAVHSVRTKGWSWIPVLLGILPFVGAYLLFLEPYARSRRSDRLRRKHGVKPSQWVFSASGIHVADEHAEHQIKWSLATKAIITKRYVLLQLGGNQYHTFASPMFTTASDWRDFRLVIIRNFFPCRTCGYDLHGTTSDVCPECGKTID